jgi:hypothetical protein
MSPARAVLAMRARPGGQCDVYGSQELLPGRTVLRVEGESFDDGVEACERVGVGLGR